MRTYKVVGWDNGYDFEKIYLSKNKLRFPSVIYKPSSNDSIFNITSTNQYNIKKMILLYQGVEYFIGDYAIDQDPLGGDRNFEKDRFKKNTEIVKLLAAMSVINPDEKEIVIENLMLGLSLQVYKKHNKDLVDKFKDRSFQYRIPSKNKSKSCVLHIKNVICIPQGIGAYYDMILNYAGQPVDDGLINVRYGLIDVGGKTTDAFISQGVEPIRGTDVGLLYGTSDVFKEVSHRVDNIPVNLIERSHIQGKKSVFWDEEYMTANLCAKSFENLADKIYRKIHEVWTRHMDRVEMIILCGGGGKDIEKHLSKLFSIKVMTVDDPQFANSRGYFKLGQYVANRE
ncbi:MAG: hypothetical protein ACOCRO_11275 [Halanaerobiales bacterium]